MNEITPKYCRTIWSRHRKLMHAFMELLEKGSMDKDYCIDEIKYHREAMRDFAGQRLSLRKISWVV